MILIVLAIISIPIIILTGMFGFIKVVNKINKFLLIAMLLTTQSQAQITPVTSFGLGYEYKNSAIPVQLTAGISSRRNELVAGYTVFFHKADATIPKVIFLRYGLNLGNEDIQIMPLVGYGMLTATTKEVAIKDSVDPLYDSYELIRTPQQFKILYGLKVQKSMGLGGLFMSYEHCKLSYVNAGLFVRIN